MLLEKDVKPLRKRAVLYCRVSTDKQEQDGESLEYQEEKGRKYAELHDMDVVIVLHEAKSGFIHYSLREKLTLARQMVRDRLADVIIVFDLRRFSRNFVHSAMIFEEIESHGGEIVSVSENIDNSLTGKLIRSILAWSAEPTLADQTGTRAAGRNRAGTLRLGVEGRRQDALPDQQRRSHYTTVGFQHVRGTGHEHP